MANNKKLKEFIENSENPEVETTEKTPGVNQPNPENVTPINQDDLLLNLILDCSDRYLPLANKVGQFLSEKFISEVDKSFVYHTLQAAKTNTLIDSESLLNQARERLRMIDYRIENTKQLVGVVNHNEAEVSNV